MKKWAACLLIVLMLILSACADTSVSYRLTEDNNVTIDYHMEIMPGTKDISTYTSEITYYWDVLDFTTDTSETNGTTTLSGTKIVACKDMNHAVSTLASIFTDEDSLFYNVEFTYTPSYFEDDFSLETDVSLENLLRQNSSGGLPAGAAQDLLDQAEKAQYTLSLELPGKVTSTNADSRDGQVCIWNLKYGEVTHIQLATTNAFSENAENYQSLQETRSRDILLLAISGGVAALALVAGLLIFFLGVRKRHRGPKIYIPEDLLPPQTR